MQLSLPFIDIIIFAIIAIFLVYRLKSILGQNSESNENNNKFEIDKKDFTNVVKLGNKKSTSKDIKIDKNTINTIYPSFDEKEFLKGAQNFFKMVINSFVKGDLNEVKDFIDSKLVKNFQSVIDERLEEEETLKIDIIKMNSIQIKNANEKNNFLRVSVLFETEQIKALKDQNNKIIDGDLKTSIIVRDIWSFERDIKSTDVNWTLVETGTA